MNDLTENAAPVQRGKPFQPGQSGNPAGKPKGARNKATLAIQALLDGEGEEIARRAIELAKSGDITAIRLVLERILPPRKDVPIEIDLPEIKNISDAIAAQSLILQAAGKGELTPTEANALSCLIEQIIKGFELHDIDKRLKALEERK